MLASEKIISLAVDLKYCVKDVALTGKDVRHGQRGKIIASGGDQIAQG